MTRSSCSIVAPLALLFLATCTESGGSGPSTERTGGTGGNRPGTGGGSVAGRGGTGGGGSGAAPGSGSPGTGGNTGGAPVDGGKPHAGSDGATGTDAAGGTGGSGGTGGMSDGRMNDARGGADGSVRDSGEADGMVRDAAGPPDKPPMADARPIRDSMGPEPMRDAAPYRDAPGPGAPNPPGGADFCPQAIRHSAEHPPGGVGVGQRIDCDNINVGRIACDQAGRTRYECVYNAGPSNPNNFGKHWEACGNRRCQTCRLTMVTERPPPYFNPFAAATCN
jgi:hypothetical protein